MRQPAHPGRRPPHLPGPIPLALAAALALALTACSPPRAADVEGDAPPPVVARAAVDRAVATTGDVITYTLTVEREPGVEVEIPDPGAEMGGLAVIDAGRGEPRRAGPRAVESRWVRLRADLVGSYTLPPVAVTYRPAGGTSRPRGTAGEPTSGGGAGGEGKGAEATAAGTVTAPEIFIEVQSVLPPGVGAADLRDIKPLQRPDTGPDPRWLAALAAAVLALAAGGWALARHRRRRGMPQEPPAPPHEVALRALDELRRGADLADPEAVRRFHFRLSEILRAYVEGRFGLNATDLTTEEILPALATLPGLPAAEATRLESFLQATDRVKFAAHRPGREQIHATWQQGVRFVAGTRPPEPAEQGAGGAPEPGPPEPGPPEPAPPSREEAA